MNRPCQNTRRLCLGHSLLTMVVTPDLEYLMQLAPRSEISHTIHGRFLFCIPMGLLTLWILHRVWKQPVLALLKARNRAGKFCQD